MRKIAREAVIFMLSGLVLYALFIAIDDYQYMHRRSLDLWNHMTLFEKAFDITFGAIISGFEFGIPAGLFVWSFYRVIRFAAKG